MGHPDLSPGGIHPTFKTTTLEIKTAGVGCLSSQPLLSAYPSVHILFVEKMRVYHSNCSSTGFLHVTLQGGQSSFQCSGQAHGHWSTVIHNHKQHFLYQSLLDVESPDKYLECS